MGTYSVEESRDRIIANHQGLALKVAREFYASQGKKLQRLGVELCDVEGEASLLLIEIVDAWDRECPFDLFCESELKSRLRPKIRAFTGEDRKHSEVQASPDFSEADRPDPRGPAADRVDFWELMESSLTEEERCVAHKRASGLKDVEIAEELGIHRTTVAARRESIERKLSSIKGELYEHVRNTGSRAGI